MRVSSVVVAALLVAAAHASGQQRKSESKPASSKGILEPVNFQHDIKLTDVFFVSADVGWVAGEHATIIKTTDAGATWTAQVGGDPANAEPTIRSLRFLDDRRGWALEDGGPAPRVLQTRDGQNWDEIGLAPRGVADYTFTNSRHGIAIANGTPEYYRGGIYVTEDSGKNWKPLAECTITPTVQGAQRKESCWVVRLQMLSDRIGYILARWFSPESPNDNSLAIFRTDDAGASWQPRLLPMHGDAGTPDFVFTDPDHGVVIFHDGKTFLTSDAGGTWKPLVGTTLGPQVHFADPQVGWTMAPGYAAKISYTTDGGLHWSILSQVELPAGDPEYKFALPRRDRGYIIGSHGMIYRYRIVPQTYTAAKSFVVPVMPTLDVAGFTANADRVRQEMAQLQARVGNTTGGAPQPTSSPSSAQPAPTGFTQDTAAPDAAAGFSQDIGAVDSSAASPPMQNCCDAQLASLQTDLGSLSGELPVLGNTYRSLNLVTAGFAMFTALRRQAQQLRTAFAAVKHARDLQAATTALQQLAGALNASQQTVTTGLPSPGQWYASGGGGFVQDVDKPSGKSNQ